jgi:SAM-dependent methyltransferase
VSLYIGLPAPEKAYDWLHLRRSFERYVRPEYSVLEIGASRPERTAWLAARCREVTGVELFPDRIPEDAPKIRYVVGDWQRLTDVVPRESIDLAVSSHVIEHVPDDLRALEELYSVLRPGGLAIVMTPNRKRLVRSVIERFSGERKFPHWEHVREYVESDLRDLIARSPFTRSEIYPVTVGLNGGPVHCYLTHVPRALRGLATFWEVHLWR